MATELKFIRVLVIEDNESRHICIRSWMEPLEIRPIFASSAGRAIGVLRRDAQEISGVMLDHDLTENAATETDLTLSGTDVVKTIIDVLPRTVPILVHSMNPAGAIRMVAQLEGCGFFVERIPMSKLDASLIKCWFEEVKESITFNR